VNEDTEVERLRAELAAAEARAQHTQAAGNTPDRIADLRRQVDEAGTAEGLTGEERRLVKESIAAENRSKPTSRAIIWISIAVVALVVGGALWAAKSSDDDNSSSTSTVHTVRYLVRGSARTADITYATSNGGTAQQNGVDVPLSRETDGAEGITYTMTEGAFVYISAQNGGEYGTIQCLIQVDGTVVLQNQSSGAYAIATCSGRL